MQCRQPSRAAGSWQLLPYDKKKNPRVWYYTEMLHFLLYRAPEETRQHQDNIAVHHGIQTNACDQGLDLLALCGSGWVLTTRDDEYMCTDYSIPYWENSWYSSIRATAQLLQVPHGLLSLSLWNRQTTYFEVQSNPPPQVALLLTHTSAHAKGQPAGNIGGRHTCMIQQWQLEMV